MKKKSILIKGMRLYLSQFCCIRKNLGKRRQSFKFSLTEYPYQKLLHGILPWCFSNPLLRPFGIKSTAKWMENTACTHTFDLAVNVEGYLSKLGCKKPQSSPDFPSKWLMYIVGHRLAIHVFHSGQGRDSNAGLVIVTFEKKSLLFTPAGRPLLTMNQSYCKSQERRAPESPQKMIGHTQKRRLYKKLTSFIELKRLTNTRNACQVGPFALLTKRVFARKGYSTSSQ